MKDIEDAEKRWRGTRRRGLRRLRGDRKW